MYVSIFDRGMEEHRPLLSNHPTLGLIVEPHSNLKHAIVVVTEMQSATLAAKIPY